MRNVFITLFLLLAAAGTALAKGEPVGLSEVTRALESPFQPGARGKTITDFEADFFQQSRLASLDRAQKGKGQVAIKFDRVRGSEAPLAKFRWDYDQPTDQEIVSNGEKMWVYLPENRQVIQSEIDFANPSRPDDPLTFLTGLGNLSRDFLITWAQPNRDPEGNFVLELRPRRPSPLIQKLLVVVDREAVTGSPRGEAIFPIRSTNVIDPGGNSTLIEFTHVRTNRGLSDRMFEFILPAGVEVIRPTGQEMGF